MKKTLNFLITTCLILGSLTTSSFLHAQPEPVVFMDTQNVKQSAWWLRLALDFQDLIFSATYPWQNPLNTNTYLNTIATINGASITGGDIFTVSSHLSLDLLRRDPSILSKAPIISQAVQNYFFAGILYFQAVLSQQNPDIFLVNWFSMGKTLVNVLLTNSVHYQSLSSSEQLAILKQLDAFVDAFTTAQVNSIQNYNPANPNFTAVIESNLASLDEAYEIGCYLDQTVYGN